MPSLYTFYDWTDRIRRYFAFSRNEALWILASIAVMTFIISFRFDDNEEFILANLISAALTGLAAVTIAVLVHETFHRIFGLNMGYRTEFKPFMFGLLAGVILAFMTAGRLVFLAYSGVFLHIMEKHRLGYFRYQLGYFDLGKVSLAGPLANLFVAILFKSLVFLPETLVDKVVLVNVLFAITNILPIPPLDGANVMYSSKTFYPFILGAVVSCGLLLLTDWVDAWVAVVASLIIGLLTAIIYFNKVEPKL